MRQEDFYKAEPNLGYLKKQGFNTLLQENKKYCYFLIAI